MDFIDLASTRVNKIEFPLYDRLLEGSKIDNIEMDDIQITNFINSLPKEHSDIILTIIYYHFYLNNGLEILTAHYNDYKKSRSTNISIIYDGKTLNKATTPIFKLDNIPPDLKSIIYSYIKLITE